MAVRCYQPTLIRDFLDPNGNVIKGFTPIVDRTVNIDPDVLPTEPR